MNRLLKNPLEGAPKPWKPWYGYLFGIVALVCVGLYIFERVSGSMLSAEMSPAERFNALLKQNPVVMRAEAKKVSEPAPEPVQPVVEVPLDPQPDVNDVAKKALEILNTEPAP